MGGTSLGIFKKWFKKSEVSEEIKEQVEPISENKQEDKTDEKTQEGLKELKVEANKIVAMESHTMLLTYENFMQGITLSNVNRISYFMDLLARSKDYISDTSRAEVEQCLKEYFDVIEHLQRLKEEVSLFKQREKLLRKQINEYTQVVNQINKKKLSKEEFEKVKAVISPKIDAINKERNKFLEEERKMDEKIEELRNKGDEVFFKCKKLAKNL